MVSKQKYTKQKEQKQYRDFNTINQSLLDSKLWNKPKDKKISSVMIENFKTLGIKYAK